MVKGRNRSGSDAAKRHAVVGKKDTRGGRNLGADGKEHSRVAKGNKTHNGPQRKR